MPLWGTKKWNVLISYHFLQMFKPLRFLGWPALWQINNWRIIHQSSSMMGINFVTVALTNNEKQKVRRDNSDKSIEGKLSTWFINTFPVYPALILLHLTRSNSLLSQVCFCDFPLSNFTKKKKSNNKISQGSDPAYSFCFFSFSFFNSQKEKQTEILEKYGWFSIFFSRIWNKIFPTRPFLLMFSVCFMSFATTFPSAWKTLPVLQHTMSYHWSCPVLFSLKTPSYEHYIKKKH